MNLTFLAQTPLFRGIAPQDITAMLGCLHGREQSFSKGQLIYGAGECVTAMGMVSAPISSCICLYRSSDGYRPHQQVP